MDPILEVRELTFRYAARPQPAIHDLSFALEEGKMALLAGPSGCGKSTLLRALNGLIPRSYKLENVRGGPIAQIRRLAPLVVPVTLHALMAAEDIIDAMDLRAFGVGRRTWLTELRFRRHDFLLLGLSAILFFGSMATAALGFGRFWTP